MRMLGSLFSVLVTGVLFTSCAVRGNSQESAKSERPAGFRGEFLLQLDDVQAKMISLAEAIPEEKYGWRPGEDARSVMEALIHFAGTNYMLMSLLGFEQPEGVTLRDPTKPQVIVFVVRSFNQVRSAVRVTSDKALENPVELFNRPTTARGVFLAATAHMHEHLGQVIAYARMNGIVPPWTAEQEAQRRR